MSFKILSVAVLVLAMQLASARLMESDAILDGHWTSQINEKLCAEGTHPDEVAAEFYDCYNNTDLPGAEQYKTCQVKVYGEHMDTQAAVDYVCTAGKFQQYATCLFASFAMNGVNPLVAVHHLAKCQGQVLGVPRPESHFHL